MGISHNRSANVSIAYLISAAFLLVARIYALEMSYPSILASKSISSPILLHLSGASSITDVFISYYSNFARIFNSSLLLRRWFYLLYF